MVSQFRPKNQSSIRHCISHQSATTQKRNTSNIIIVLIDVFSFIFPCGEEKHGGWMGGECGRGRMGVDGRCGEASAHTVRVILVNNYYLVRVSLIHVRTPPRSVDGTERIDTRKLGILVFWLNTTSALERCVAKYFSLLLFVSIVRIIVRCLRNNRLNSRAVHSSAQSKLLSHWCRWE